MFSYLYHTWFSSMCMVYFVFLLLLVIWSCNYILALRRNYWSMFSFFVGCMKIVLYCDPFLVSNFKLGILVSSYINVNHEFLVVDHFIFWWMFVLFFVYATLVLLLIIVSNRYVKGFVITSVPKYKKKWISFYKIPLIFLSTLINSLPTHPYLFYIFFLQLALNTILKTYTNSLS